VPLKYINLYKKLLVLYYYRGFLLDKDSIIIELERSLLGKVLIVVSLVA